MVIDSSEEPITFERPSLNSGDERQPLLKAQEQRVAESLRRRRYDATTQQRQRSREAWSSTNTEHVCALNERYEGLNYEVAENSLLLEEMKAPGYQKLVLQQAFNRWVVCFLTGFGTACVGFFIYITQKYMENWKFSLLVKSFNACTSRGFNCAYQPLLVWIGFNLFFVSIAASLVLFVAGPVAAGSGIPQIKCFLNGVKIPKVVSFRTLLAKAVGIICSVSGGLTVGREGPMIHSGACVAANIAKGRLSKPFSLDLKVFEYYRTDKELRDFVSVGAAAGVAAAFGAPIGGVLFSLEEGVSFWNQALTWRMFFGAMTSSFFLNLFKSLANGRANDLSWIGLVDFGSFTDMSCFNTWEILVYIFIGIAGGLLGALFNHINYKLTLFRMDYIRSKWVQFVEVLLVAAVTAVTGFMSCYFIQECFPNQDGPFRSETAASSGRETDKPIKMFCLEGNHSCICALFMRTPETATSAMFHEPIDAYGPITLIVFWIEMFLLSCWTYGLSVASSNFIPSLLTGAAMGRLIAVCLNMICKDLVTDAGKFALAGAAAQLAGNVRMTISLCVILIEATRDVTFGLPLMIILTLAKWVGDYFNEGLYDIHINLNEVPLLGWEPPYLAGKVRARQVMAQPVRVLRELEEVGRVYDFLTSDLHNGYPVVDSYAFELEEILGAPPPHFGKYRGFILRSQLIVLLQNKQIFIPSSDAGSDEGSQYTPLPFIDTVKRLTSVDFRKKYPKYEKELTNISLTENERRSYIDLRPYMDKAPYSISMMSLNKLYQLFRGLGLRHLVVVDADNHVIGIVTRKDIARFKCERIAGKILIKELPISTDDV